MAPRTLASLALASALCACTTYFPRNTRLEAWQPDYGYRASNVEQPGDSKQLVLSLAFSGGGTRAAAFAFGALEELAATQVELDGRRRSLFDEIDAVSGVSGGSFVAADLALRGREMLSSFPEQVLERNIQAALLVRLLWPLNWLKLFSSYWARSDLAASYYDAKLYDHASFGDLIGRGTPFAQIHATDLTTGSPFAFIQEQFDYLCSDLSSYPLARAVAASAAVPLVLSPISLRNYHDCGFAPPDWVREAHRSGKRTLDRSYHNAGNLLSYVDGGRRFVRLVDGGISDNLGVRGPFEAWFHRTFDPPERRPGLELRHVVLLIVNAQSTPENQWDTLDTLPSLAFILDAVTSVQINRYNFETIELLRRTFELWNARTSAWEPPLSYHLLELSFLDVADETLRKRLNNMGTRLHLATDDTLALRSAARQALREHPGFQSLLEQIAR